MKKLEPLEIYVFGMCLFPSKYIPDELKYATFITRSFRLYKQLEP